MLAIVVLVVTLAILMMMILICAQKVASKSEINNLRANVTTFQKMVPEMDKVDSRIATNDANLKNNLTYMEGQTEVGIETKPGPKKTMPVPQVYPMDVKIVMLGQVGYKIEPTITVKLGKNKAVNVKFETAITSTTNAPLETQWTRPDMDSYGNVTGVVLEQQGKNYLHYRLISTINDKVIKKGFAGPFTVNS